jgi:hypothetical protein
MIPLGLKSSETTKVYTFKFNPVFHWTCVKQVSLRSGFQMSTTHRGNSSISTLTESTRYLHKLYFHELPGLCCTVAQESALLGYDVTSLGNQFPAF